MFYKTRFFRRNYYSRQAAQLINRLSKQPQSPQKYVPFWKAKTCKRGRLFVIWKLISRSCPRRQWRRTWHELTTVPDDSSARNVKQLQHDGEYPKTKITFDKVRSVPSNKVGFMAFWCTNDSLSLPADDRVTSACLHANHIRYKVDTANLNWQLENVIL